MRPIFVVIANKCSSTTDAKPLREEGKSPLKLVPRDSCDPPELIRHLSQTRAAGFATERTITLEQRTEGTLLRVDAFVVGRPEMAGGASEFLRSLTTRWFDEFVRYCENYTVSGIDSHRDNE